MLRARRLGILGAALLAGVLSAPVGIAHAEFRSVPPPPGGLWGNLAVADSARWAAADASREGVNVTDDGGASWTYVPAPGNSAMVRGIGAAADGTFRMVVASWPPPAFELQLRVYRVSADGDATPVGGPIAANAANPLVADDGTVWMVEMSPSVSLWVVRPDGSASNVAIPGANCQPCPNLERTLLGPRVVRLDGTLRLDGSQLVPAEPHPIEFADGSFWLGGGLASWDGGVHWGMLAESAIPVPRSPGLGNPRLLQTYSGRLATRFSSWLFRGTGLVVSRLDGLYPTVVDAGDKIVAWTASGIYVHDGPLPDFPAAVGDLASDTREMVERANVFRADAGIPPLAGDALISQASRNHSRYTALNGPDDDEFRAHNETTWKEGFTGVGPSERCAAVGASCSGEVMFTDGESDPVGGWLATPFHRSVPGSPIHGTVGGGHVPGGSWTMNGGEKIGILVDAFGYPNGVWRGDSGFAGERPDPVADCQSQGQDISYPVGIAVALYSPASSDNTAGGNGITRISVRNRGGGRPLPGCLLEGSDGSAQFLLDDPLVPGETYDAEGDWDAGGLLRTHRWSFTYSPEPGRPPRSGRRSRRRESCMGRRATMIASRGKVTRGARRSDVVLGTGGPDRVRTGRGRDRVCSRGGRDRIAAGAGNDLIDPGSGRDRITAGAGNDHLRLINGRRDRAQCGSGKHDNVVADRGDKLRGCEHVKRIRGR